MSETILDSLVVRLRADTDDFRTGLDASADALDGLGKQARAAADGIGGVWQENGFGPGFSSVIEGMEGALERFVRKGKLSFADLRETILSILADIARSWVEALASAGGGQGSGQGGGDLLSNLARAAGSLFTPRATGGPVAAGMPYLIGEQGPELFVPERSGRIVPSHLGSPSLEQRPVNITINMNGSGGDPQRTRESAGQIAAALRRTLAAASRNM